ncbi:MAG: prepilin-type N-terminal cleavage/methylation domain-containing protein [Pseudomonadota bacterium]
MRVQSGFTLMELIGVMAILAILSAVMAPSIVSSINDAYGTAEAANLQRITDDLERYVRRNGRIPSATVSDWTNAVATLSSLPTADLALNRRGFARRLYFDPNFFTAGGGFSGYQQTDGLTAAPLSPRVMLISDLTGNVGFPGNNATTFDDIWNQTPGTALVESDRLFIQRLHLGGLFKEVLVTNTSANQAAISFNTAAAVAVPAAGVSLDGVLSRFVIEDTRLLVYADPYPTGDLRSVFKITDDLGLRYVDQGSGFIWIQP